MAQFPPAPAQPAAPVLPFVELYIRGVDIAISGEQNVFVPVLGVPNFMIINGNQTLTIFLENRNNSDISVTFPFVSNNVLGPPGVHLIAANQIQMFSVDVNGTGLAPGQCLVHTLMVWRKSFIFPVTPQNNEYDLVHVCWYYTVQMEVHAADIGPTDDQANDYDLAIGDEDIDGYESDLGSRQSEFYPEVPVGPSISHPIVVACPFGYKKTHSRSGSSSIGSNGTRNSTMQKP